MARLCYLFIAVVARAVAAVNLYVASYNGNLTSLSLTKNGDESYCLEQTYTFNTSANAPSWLTLNKQNNILYLVDEAVNYNATQGALISYRTSYTGEVTQLDKLITPVGGVDATFFANGAGMTVPHYTGSALYSYKVTSDGRIAPAQDFVYSMSGPGPVPDRQDSPHPHETILDPTGQYILIPDLGADLVRVYAVFGSSLSERAPLRASPGSGPRHAAFSIDTVNGKWYLYLAGEISATVTTCEVTYLPSQGGLNFTDVSIVPSLGPGIVPPPTTTGESTGVTAEISISPDGRFVLVSNRRDLTFNDTSPPSDSMAVFRISPDNGTLSFVERFPAGGSYPRQFAINKAGTLVAVGLQQSSLVAILSRDVESGKFVDEVARISVEGQITCVVWDE